MGTAVRQLPLDGASDAALVAGVIAGNDAAVATIFRRHAPRLRGVLIRSIGPGHDVEDLLQDVFVAFCRHPERLRDASVLQGYLVGMALRTARMELRRRKVRRIVSLAPAEEFPQVTADPQAPRALYVLYRILDGLPSRERLVFIARHVEGMQLDEVAQAMELSKATVWRADKRARARVLSQARQQPLLAPYLPQPDASDGGVVP